MSRSRLFTYDDVVERVAQQLGLDDPSKIRLTPHNCYSQQPKPQPIKYRGVEHLSDMLVHYNQVVIDKLIIIFSFGKTIDLTPLFNVRPQIYYTMKYLTSLYQNYKVWKLWKLHFIMPLKMKWVCWLDLSYIFFVNFCLRNSFMFFFIYFYQVVIHTIRLPKQSTVGDVLDDLKTKVKFLSFDSLSYPRPKPLWS